MHARAAANAYRRVHIESASPARLLDELFVTLLADLGDAERCIKAGDAPGKGSAINHALAIISTLRVSLQAELAPELCASLSALYDFAADRLTDANLRFDARPIGETRRILTTLREAFSAAAVAAPHQASGG